MAETPRTDQDLAKMNMLMIPKAKTHQAPPITLVNPKNFTTSKINTNTNMPQQPPPPQSKNPPKGPPTPTPPTTKGRKHQEKSIPNPFDIPITEDAILGINSSTTTTTATESKRKTARTIDIKT